MSSQIPLDELSLEIQEQNTKHPFSGLVEVRQKGQVVFTQALGFANRSDHIPISSFTRFGMASGSKTFTSTAICKLVDQGKIRFDTPLKDCVGVTIPQFDESITLHQLLTHSSGIPDYFNEEETDDYEAIWKEHPTYNYRSPADFLPFFKDMPSKFKPGERFSYCNSGYILLGMVIEHITGKPFTRVITEEVLQPAGMTRSGYFPLDQLPEGTAQGYILERDGGWRSNIFSLPIIGGGDGGAYTTGEDLAKFWGAIISGRLITPDSLERMLFPHLRTNPSSKRTGYGYGLWIGKKNDVPEVFYMIGEDPGVAFYSGYFPARDLIFTLMGNTSEAAFNMLSSLIALVKKL